MPITTVAVSPGARRSGTTGLPLHPTFPPNPCPHSPTASRPCRAMPCHTDLRELLYPHARQWLGFVDSQVLHLSVGVVGDLDLDGHHVGVTREGPAAEAVLNCKPLACHAVQQLVGLHCIERWAQQLHQGRVGTAEGSLQPLQVAEGPGAPTGDRGPGTSPGRAWGTLTVGVREVSVRVRPSRSVTRLVEMTLLEGMG